MYLSLRGLYGIFRLINLSEKGTLSHSPDQPFGFIRSMPIINGEVILKEQEFVHCYMPASR